MTVLARFSKALFAIPVPLLGLLVAFGVDLTLAQQEAVLAVVTVLTPLVVIVAPANAPKDTDAPPSRGNVNPTAGYVTYTANDVSSAGGTGDAHWPNVSPDPSQSPETP